VDADWATARSLRVVANNLFGKATQQYVPNVYPSHAQSGEGFHQAPTHQKKCNEPYLESVKRGGGMESGISFQGLMHHGWEMGIEPTLNLETKRLPDAGGTNRSASEL